MAETTILKVIIDGRQAERQARDLERRFNATERAGDRLSDATHRGSAAFKAMAANAFSLQGALAGIGLTQAIRQAVQYADVATSVDNKLRQITKSQLEFNQAQSNVFSIAKETRSDLEATATLYARTARRADQLGISQQQVATFTKAVNQSLAAYGATGQEAASATLQLSQALGKGVLNGDEFRSISEAAPPLMKAIAEAAGVAEGDLKDMGAAGKLSAELVVQGVLQAAETFENDFSKAIATFDSQMNVARTNMVAWAGESENLKGITADLASAVVGLTANIDEVIAVGGLVATVYAGRVANGFFAANAASIKYAHNLVLGEASSLKSSKADIGRAKAAEAAAAGDLKKANAALHTAKAETQVWRETVKRTKAELELEAARTKSQITSKGRQASLVRQIKLRRDLTAVTGQLTAAETRLASANAAASVSAGRASKATKAFALASGNASKGMRLLAGAGKLASGGLSLIGGPAGAALVAAYAISELVDRSVDAAKEIDGLTESMKRFNELESQFSRAATATQSGRSGRGVQAFAALESQIKGAQNTANLAGNAAEFDQANTQLDGLLLRLEQLVSIYPELASAAQKYLDLQNKKEKGISDAATKTLAGLEAEKNAYLNGGKALEQYLEQKQLTAAVARASKGFREDEIALIEKEIINVREAKKTHQEELELKEQKALKEEELRRKELAQAEEFSRLKTELDPVSALESEHEKALKLINDQAKSEEERLSLIDLQTKAYEEQLVQLKGLSAEHSKMSFDDFSSSIAGSISAFQGLSEEGTDAYRQLGAAAQVFEQISVMAALSRQAAEAEAARQAASESAKVIAAKTAEGTAAAATGVANQATGDPYTAFARMAAMAAAMASLGFAVKGAFGGDDKAFDLSSVQAAQGTGSVLGDAAAQSESIANAIESMERNADIEVGYSAQMLRQLQQLNANISGLGTLLARQFGDFTLNDPSVAHLFDSNGASKLFGSAHSFTNAISPIQSFIDDVVGIDFLGLAGDFGTALFDGLFGKTTATVVNSGIAIQAQSLGDLMAGGIQQASLDALQFATIEVKKKSWFSSSTSYQRRTQALGDDINRQLGLVVGGLYDSVLLGAQAAFGLDVSSALNATNIAAQDISLRGLSGDERTEALQSVFGKIGDQMAGVIPRLSEFQVAGEGLFETLGRVAADVQRAEYQLEAFGLTMGDIYAVAGEADVALELIRDALADNAGAAAGLIENFAGAENELVEFAERIFDLQTTFGLMGMNVDSLTESMIRGARGTEALVSGVDAYIGGFLTDSEQLAIQRGQLTAELATAGIDLPATRQAYRDLLEGLDLTTDEGQRLAGALFASAEAADSLYSTIEESQQAQIEAQLQVVSGLRSLVTGAQAVYSPASLSRLQQSFFATANQARAGDLGSAEALVGIGQNVLSAASSEARSRYEYERIAATVAGTANSIANMFDVPSEVDLLEQQLTVLEEIRDQSPAFNTDNAVSTNDEIKALKAQMAEMTEQLREGFYAVTKQTMKTAKTLDRWDGDGLPEERAA